MDRAALAAQQWTVEKPELDLLAMESLGRLMETALLIERDHLVPLFKSYGLQSGEFDVLATLRRAGAPFALTPTVLFEATMISSGGMTARLDRLEKRDLIERKPNPDDRRGTLVVLTDTGRELIDQAVVAHVDNEKRILSSLSQDEQRQLNALLKKLGSGL